MRRYVYLSAALLAISTGAGFVATACRDAGAAPAQPLPFPHINHTENQIDCAFCHEFYDDYAAAGMPQTELCGNCHLAMPQESEASQKLIEYVEAEKSIPWVRLYDLPQYAYFPHKWHVRAGVECSECHGDVGTSTLASRHVEPEMDWCLECHEQREASVDCATCHK